MQQRVLAMSFERRKHVRMPSFLGGRVQMRHLSSTLDCIIRNMSPAGGRIVLAAPALLPAAFDLNITSRDQLFRARIIWRNELHAGVAFEAPEANDSEPVSLDMVRKIKRLEAENAHLARRVEELSSGA
jgi:hypothetical protein